MTTIREQVAEISPPWLRDEVGGSIMRAFGTVLDALAARTVEGVKLRFPEVATYTALGYIGNDRQIERGPSQTHTGYAAQLRKAFDTWRNAGGARTVLSQMRLHFAPANGPTMRVVAEGRGGWTVWHWIAPTTGVVTREKVVDNWNWNNAPDYPGLRRGWLIIYAQGAWLPDHWGDPGDWGDGGVWGSNMTEGEAIDINALVRKWKPAGLLAQIILTFDASLFEVTDNLAGNVNGQGESYAWRAGLAANFFMPQGI